MLGKAELMLLDTWYTVVSYTPHCRMFLTSADSGNGSRQPPVLFADFSCKDVIAHLTMGAIVAQMCRVQLHLKAAGCNLITDYVKLVTQGAFFDMWLSVFIRAFDQDCMVGHGYDIACMHAAK